MTARDDLLQTFADWFLTTGRGSREIADRILAKHAHELAEQIRAAASTDGPGATWNWWDAATIPGSCADLIDPEVESQS